MIRIHLQPARRRLLPLLLLALGIFLVGILAMAYLVREEHPSLPPELAAVSEPFPPAVAVEAPVSPPEAADPQVSPPLAPADVPEAPAPALPPIAASGTAAVEEPIVPPPAEKSTPPRAEAKTAPAALQRPAPAKGQAQAPILAPTGPFCLRIVQFLERLPAVARCDTLSGTAAGEYILKGTIPDSDFPQLVVLLDGLLRLPSQAKLSGGRAGKKEGDYGFKIHGQFPVSAASQTAPAVLEATQASGLFTQAATLARKSRLDSVRVGAPRLTPVGKGVVQQRQKLWATGSYLQLKTFLEALIRQQPQLRLEEVMLVPLYQGEGKWKQAHFYAVLSAAVRAAR